jgi:hypothetical protein
MAPAFGREQFLDAKGALEMTDVRGSVRDVVGAAVNPRETANVTTLQSRARPVALRRMVLMPR